MDVKAEIEKIIAKVSKDGDLKEKFTKDPSGTVKSLVGDKVDKDTLEKIVASVKAMIGKGNLGEIGGKLQGALGGLLGGKDDAKKDDGKKE